MKIIIVVISIVLLGGAGAFVYFNANQLFGGQGQSSNATIKSISNFEELQTEIASGDKLYDVRTKEEYDSGYFKNAINFPLQDIQAGIYPDAPKDIKIYVYCRSGNRSAQAVALLKSAGYINIIDLGGLAEMEALGGKLITSQ